MFHSITGCSCVFSCCSPLPCLFCLPLFQCCKFTQVVFSPVWLWNCQPAQYCNCAFSWRRILFSKKLQFCAGFVFLKDRLFSFGIVQHLRFVLYATGITICTYTIAVLSRCYPLLSPCCHIDPESENLPWVLPITQVYFCMCLFFRKSVLKKHYLYYNPFTFLLLFRFVYSYKLNWVQIHAGCLILCLSSIAILRRLYALTLVFCVWYLPILK